MLKDTKQQSRRGGAMEMGCFTTTMLLFTLLCLCKYFQPIRPRQFPIPSRLPMSANDFFLFPKLNLAVRGRRVHAIRMIQDQLQAILAELYTEMLENASNNGISTGLAASSHKESTLHATPYSRRKMWS
jgi:hypothetical protein